MKYNSIICLTKRFYRQGSYMEIALQQKKKITMHVLMLGPISAVSIVQVLIKNDRQYFNYYNPML